LRKLGITLRQLPGEFSVIPATEATRRTRTAETLDEALALGQAMARRGRAAAGASRGRRSRRPLRMTPKAVRRRMIANTTGAMRARAKHRDDD